MLQTKIQKYTLQFKQPGGTSRGVLHTKNSWIISLSDTERPDVIGKGEASIIEGLSPDWGDDYEIRLAEICRDADHHVNNNFEDIQGYPSVRFALESAMLDLQNGGKGIYFPSAFTKGQDAIRVNGLIWMGSKEYMEQQIQEKLEKGFSCIKLKIGALDFETELDLLKAIRERHSPAEIELRVDANGAFSVDEAPFKIDQLAKLGIHSIEQPIEADQHEAMRKLCASTPVPIALDEELIGVYGIDKKEMLLSYIRPQYIILKPGLIGGFGTCDRWIAAAERNQAGWWITSALESNIGLNAIAQYTYTKNNPLHHGLGTGQLFSNNFESSLTIENGELKMKSNMTVTTE